MRSVLATSTVEARLERFEKGLDASRYSLRTAHTSAETWRGLLRHQPDAIIVDASAPSAELSPWLLCNELQVATRIPLIVLVRPGRNRDRLRAFRSGAAQCLAVPVSPAELEVALDTLFESGAAADGRSQFSSNEGYADSWVRIDLVNRQVCRGEETYSLTLKEWELIRHLLQERGQIVRSETLYEAVWKEGDPKRRWQRLKTYVGRLRQKIELEPKHPCYIVARRGLGYSFVPQTSVGRNTSPELEVSSA